MDGQNGGNEPVNPQVPDGMGMTENANAPVDAGVVANDGTMSPATSDAGMVTDGGAMPAETAGADYTTGGAIFSDPNLTIEKDAIPEDISTGEIADAPASTADTAGDASRVAAAFASTDASKNVAPIGNNAITQSTATGDIKLAPTARKKMGKLPVIIGIGVVAIIVIVVILLATMGGGSLMSYFTEYYDYSQQLFGENNNDTESVVDDEDDDEDDDGDVDDWRSEEDRRAIEGTRGLDSNSEDETEDIEEAVDEVILSGEEIAELQSKFDRFRQAVYASNSIKLDGIREKVDILAQYLLVAERAIAPEKTKASLISAYDDGGEDAVRELVEGMFLSDPKDDLYTLSELEINYFIWSVKLYTDSKKIGCTQGDEIAFNCTEEYYKDGGFTVNSQNAKISEAFSQMTSQDSITVLGAGILRLNAEIKDELEKL